VTATSLIDAVADALGPGVGRDAPLGALTTYRVGGTAALSFVVEDEDDLRRVRQAVAGSGLPVLVLGRGSNMLVADAGFAGLVVRLGTGFEAIEERGDGVVRAGGACDLPVLARRTVQFGLTGLEWAVGVPGSVGGAVRMNAGGHGSDIASCLIGYRSFDLASDRGGDAPAERLELAYRSSTITPSEVVEWAEFALSPSDPSQPDAGRDALTEIVRWRRANQPGGANAGSVFTNPPGDAAGRLVEAAGLKGFRLGTAHVSEKHANFIQADADGSADDVLRLMQHVRSEVARRFGVELATEVRLIGFGSGENDSERSMPA
jgi:UDP-N-acetylmuramate dehydrogenase